jgi:putative transposase
MQILHYQQQVTSVIWVVMPDHLHWLFQLIADNSLSNVMQTLKGRSSNAINRYHLAIKFAWQ